MGPHFKLGGPQRFQKNQHFQVSLTCLGSEVVFAAHATGGGTSVNKMHNSKTEGTHKEGRNFCSVLSATVAIVECKIKSNPLC